MRLCLLSFSSILLLIPVCAKLRPSSNAKLLPSSHTLTHNGDFTLKAEVIEALEGGPIVLHITLAYHGKNRIVARHPQIMGNLGLFESSIFIPKTWRLSEMSRIFPYHGITGSRIFGPGEELSEIVYAHEEFNRIPSGCVSLKVSCPLQIKGKPKEELITDLAVDVRPATPEHVVAVRRRMEAALNRGRGDLDRWILGTRHRAFVPVALQIIEKYDYLLDNLLDFSYCLSTAQEEVHARMVTLACKPGWKGRADLFRYWRSRGYDDPKAPKEALGSPTLDYDYQYWPSHRTAIPPQQFSKLLKNRNPWTRILTYATFPARCPSEWKHNLLENCRQLTQPLPTTQLTPLLRDLDDDVFAVREKTSAQLEQFGQRIESQLKQALQTNLTPEAKHRVILILERIAAAKQEPEWKPIFNYLVSGDCDKDAAVAVLRAFAKGNPDAALTKAAVASLKELSERK